jgi:hypothetical protein
VCEAVHSQRYFCLGFARHRYSWGIDDRFAAMKSRLIHSTETRYRSAFLHAWRGEIGLYRAAYSLGGLGLALASLIGDALLSSAASTGGAIGCLVSAAVAAGELAFAWVFGRCYLASSAEKPDQQWSADGRLGVATALAFVAVQFFLLAGWIEWSGFAAVGFAPDPGRVLVRVLAWAMGMNQVGL